MSARARRAVFLDRDGTINRELAHPIARPAELEILPGVPDALATLAAEGFALVIVSNQSAIARGDLDHERLARVHESLLERLDGAGVRIDLILACPHHPTEGLAPYRRACACRKPASGLIEQAAARLALDVADSWIVGDAERDLIAGARLGARPILVMTGKGAREAARAASEGRPIELVEPDLRAAARRIVAAPRDR